MEKRSTNSFQFCDSRKGQEGADIGDNKLDGRLENFKKKKRTELISSASPFVRVKKKSIKKRKKSKSRAMKGIRY